jgi:periplasmic divalent cation tolerance protein
MKTVTNYLLVLSTVPNQATAEQLANILVEKKLAACVNIIPQLSSVYEWQGQIVTESECLLLIKTLSTSYQEVTTCIQQYHPYTLPEIIALPIIKGEQNYLTWLTKTVNKL